MTSARPSPVALARQALGLAWRGFGPVLLFGLSIWVAAVQPLARIFGSASLGGMAAILLLFVSWTVLISTWSRIILEGSEGNKWRLAALLLKPESWGRGVAYFMTGAAVFCLPLTLLYHLASTLLAQYFHAAVLPGTLLAVEHPDLHTALISAAQCGALLFPPLILTLRFGALLGARSLGAEAEPLDAWKRGSAHLLDHIAAAAMLLAPGLPAAAILIFAAMTLPMTTPSPLPVILSILLGLSAISLGLFVALSVASYCALVFRRDFAGR
jgi:hypothetical protein